MRKAILITILAFTACMQAQPQADVPQRASSDFRVQLISEDLPRPWGVAVLPGGDYLVTGIAGTLTRVSGTSQREITGLPDDILVYGQGGLLGLVLAPDFESSGEIFLSYSFGTQDNNGTGVYRARLQGDGLVDGRVIYRSSTKSAGSHYGSRLVFLPDDTLVVSLGDGFAYREQAQKLDNTLGKTVRLHRDGSPPADNPFVGSKDTAPEIYSYGHRNVQGLSWDAKEKQLWAHEHGPRGGDELNLIVAGENYGWPLATTGIDYNGARISPYTSYEGTQAPVYDWVPSIAPSGLVIYRGELFPEWQGDALIGALADRSIWRVNLEDGKATGVEKLLADQKLRVRDVQIDRDGALLVLSETASGGKLIRLMPG